MGLSGLLAEFDAVSGKHNGMAVEKFNDDGTYKACIVTVRRWGWRGGGGGRVMGVTQGHVMRS